MLSTIDYTNYVKSSDFIKLPEGDNIVRIISKGVVAYKHKMKSGGRFIPLGLCTGEGCRNCEKSEPYKCFMWLAINRTTGQVGVLEAGATIGNGIAELAHSRAEDPKTFDILINRKGSTKETTKYQILASPETKDLTEAEKERVRFNRPYLMRKYLT